MADEDVIVGISANIAELLAGSIKPLNHHRSLASIESKVTMAVICLESR